MANRKQKPDQKALDHDRKAPESSEELTLRPAGDVYVDYRPQAAPSPPGKQIHPRRPLPPVPDPPVKPEPAGD